VRRRRGIECGVRIVRLMGLAWSRRKRPIAGRRLRGYRATRTKKYKDTRIDR